jgi:uncharacterized low-complexity protein
MLALRVFLTLAISALALAEASSASNAERDVDCQAQYGPYEVYTGSCSNTNCGAQALNCTKRRQYCVPYPCKHMFSSFLDLCA